MKACTSCHKPKSTCNCPNDIPAYHHEKKSCGCQTSCGCETSSFIEAYAKPDACCPVTKQTDARDVFYKLRTNPNRMSNLDKLGVPKGTDLETILELFGKYIANFSYFDFSNNMYDAKDFVEFMAMLQEDIQSLHLEICNLSEKQEMNTIMMNSLVARIDKLEKPGITDTRGLGFTKTDSIFKVLQELSNN